MLIAEAAEIETRTNFIDWRTDDKDEESPRIKRAGLIGRIHYPSIVNRCLELLRDLLQQIEETGFQPDRDMAILTKLYGEDGFSRGTLRETYSKLARSAVGADQNIHNEANEQSKRKILAGIVSEIGRVESEEKRLYDSMRREDIKVLCRRVPHDEVMERLLRYQASLERAFDRVLAQLERWQRLRRGQPVAPRLDVSIS